MSRLNSNVKRKLLQMHTTAWFHCMFVPSVDLSSTFSLWRQQFFQNTQTFDSSWHYHPRPFPFNVIISCLGKYMGPRVSWEVNSYLSWLSKSFGQPSQHSLISALWYRLEINTEQIAIQSFAVPRVRKWAKWASERMSERSGGRERSEQSGASKRVSGAREWANVQASGPVLHCILGCYRP